MGVDAVPRGLRARAEQGLARYRHWVEVQAPTVTADTDGGAVETWGTLTNGARWAQVEPVSGGFAERWLSSKLVDVATHIVRTPWFAGVTTSCQVVFGTRTFAVRGVSNLGERDRELLLACEERA